MESLLAIDLGKLTSAFRAGLEQMAAHRKR
jgi:hypothetical protein